MRETKPESKLHPNIRSVWRFAAFISGAVGAAILAVPTLLFTMAADGPFLAFGIAAAILGFVLFGGISLLLVDKQFERWSYELRPYDIVIRKGILWQNERTIARDRVQHIDINAGPMDRRFGLVQVVIYAAGIMGSVGLIPGLTPEDAEWLKEQLLATRAVDV